jgi:hypothetical protein
MSDEKSREVEARFRVVVDRYGDRLTPEELEEVRKAVEANLDAAYALRSIKLENWDEPFSVFKPLRRRRP